MFSLRGSYLVQLGISSITTGYMLCKLVRALSYARWRDGCTRVSDTLKRSIYDLFGHDVVSSGSSSMLSQPSVHQRQAANTRQGLLNAPAHFAILQALERSRLTQRRALCGTGFSSQVACQSDLEVNARLRVDGAGFAISVCHCTLQLLYYTHDNVNRRQIQMASF